MKYVGLLVCRRRGHKGTHVVAADKHGRESSPLMSSSSVSISLSRVSSHRLPGRCKFSYHQHPPQKAQDSRLILSLLLLQVVLTFWAFQRLSHVESLPKSFSCVVVRRVPTVTDYGAGDGHLQNHGIYNSTGRAKASTLPLSDQDILAVEAILPTLSNI